MNGQTLVNTYLPLPGGATLYETPGAKNFWHNDWLGTARLSSTSAHAIVYDRAFAPFGEPYSTFGTANAGMSFTGDTQDTFIVSGSTPLPYDTPDRELHPIQGRWLSPDPAGLAAVDPTNPQSWNRYAYVGNNPLAFVDPSGDQGENPCTPLWYGGVSAATSGGYGPTDVRTKGCPDPSLLVTPPCSFAGVSTAPCDPSQPQPGCPPNAACGDSGSRGGSGPANTVVTIGAYHGSVDQCLLQATIDAGLDLTSLSLLPSANQDDWQWSWDKLGFVYVGGAEGESLLSASNAVDAVGTAADFVHDTSRAQALIRQGLRSGGYKLSLKAVSKDAALLGKVAGAFGKVTAAKSAYDRYQKCRGY